MTAAAITSLTRTPGDADLSALGAALAEPPRAHAPRAPRRAGPRRQLIDGELVAGGDGRHRHERARADRLSASGRDLHYRLTPAGRERLSGVGVALPAPDTAGAVAVRYCVDWTEQAHHLSGAVGRALTARLLELGWLARLPRTRAVRLTPAGEAGLAEAFGVRL